jgi:tight adherence protein C
MPVQLIVLIGMLVVAVAAAAYALVRDHERRAALERAGAYGANASLVLKAPTVKGRARLARWLMDRAPESWRERKDVADALVHAGFDGPAAPVVYTAARLAAIVLAPLAVMLLAPRRSGSMFILLIAIGAGIGFMLPQAYIARRARLRQERLRRALPDSLDLLVVCVEAGISLDAAIVRVAREMAILHPDLADELMIVNRRVNAGMPRERALHGLWQRTGVEELRGLASNMIQSEKWGTSIATVLRVYAESLRLKRKQAAEKKAATAPLKMMFPLAVFIFPAIFIVLLGPAIVKIGAMFKTIAH